MKVLMVVPNIVSGGVDTVVTNLKNGLENSNWKVETISIMPVGERKDINTLNIKSKFGLGLAILRFFIFVRKSKPDLIHAHTVFPIILTLLIKILFFKKIKIVATEHGTIDKETSKKFIYKMFSFLSSHLNQILFVSQTSMKSYVQNKLVDPKKCFVIYNGIEKVEENNYFNVDPMVRFCYVGRFSQEKNIGLLLNSFLEFSDRVGINNVNLTMLGDGQLFNEFKNKIEEKKVKNVFLLGFKDNPKDYIKNCDCLLLSSYTEGLPTVIIEAFSMKKSVISTDCGGVGEMIKNNNFLVKNNNKSEYVKSLMCFYNMTSDEKKKNGNVNYEIFINNFTLSKMVENYEIKYQEVLNDF